MNNTGGILLFDGVCNLCNGIVQFTIKRDPEGKFMFGSLQSDAGKALLKKGGLPADDFDSFVYIKDGKYYLRSTAGLKVLKEIGGIWKLFYPFIIIPESVRDIAYRFIAGNRYKIFGKKDVCMVPSPSIEKRFLK